MQDQTLGNHPLFLMAPRGAPCRPGQQMARDRPAYRVPRNPHVNPASVWCGRTFLSADPPQP